jgi:hypothetical protein
MPTLSFIDALNVIDDAYCVVVDANELVYPIVDLEDETIRIELEHGDPIYINSSLNGDIEVVNCGTELRFTDENGESVDLKPLVSTKIKA